MNAGLYVMPVPSNAGMFTARFSERGLVALNFPDPASKRRSNQKFASSGKIPRDIRNWHRQTEAALQMILAGRPPLELPPFDWTGKTEFQRAVWGELGKISPGETKSYGEIAQLIGRPRAVRAVGGACGANPIPVLVPCHRVLAANRRLGGFSGGLEWKRTLLAREGLLL